MKLLYITASPNKEKSASREVSDYLVSRINSSSLKVLDLDGHPIPHLSGMAVSAFFSPEENLSPEQKEAIKLSDEKVEELLESDMVVISTPMWNLGVPSVLKSWLDHVSRAGKTFQFSSEGFVGLAGGRKVYLVVSSGSVFSEGRYSSLDHLIPWFKSTLTFMGLTDLEVIRVEGTNTSEAATNAIEKAKIKIDQILNEEEKKFFI